VLVIAAVRDFFSVLQLILIIAFVVGGDISPTSSTLDNSRCGQTNVKWAVCTASSCTYKSGVTFPSSCTGGAGVTNRVFMCIDEPAVLQAACPAGYSFSAALSICYKLVTATKTAHLAAVDCVNSGGALMAASSDARNNFIINSVAGTGRAWIGLTWNADNGVFEW
jgi:hypothetical protein